MIISAISIENCVKRNWWKRKTRELSCRISNSTRVIRSDSISSISARSYSPSIKETGTFNCWWWWVAGCCWWWCGGCSSRCDLVWEKVGDGGSQGRATPVLTGTSSSWQQNLSLALEAVVPVQFATPCPSLLLLISPLLLLLLLLPLLLLFVRRVVVAPVAGLPLPLALPLTLPLPMPSTCTISLSIAAADLAVPGGVATPPPIIITRWSHLRPLHALSNGSSLSRSSSTSADAPRLFSNRFRFAFRFFSSQISECRRVSPS